MKEINTSEFNELKGAAVVDFSATWCGPCRMLRPILEEVEAEYSDIQFVSVDVDENPDLCEKFGINSVPCVIFTKDGQEVSRFVGFVPKKMVKSFIDTNK